MLEKLFNEKLRSGSLFLALKKTDGTQSHDFSASRKLTKFRGERRASAFEHEGKGDDNKTVEKQITSSRPRYFPSIERRKRLAHEIREASTPF